MLCPLNNKCMQSELQFRTCVSDKKDEAWSICRQLFQQKPEARAASSPCIHTAVKGDTAWAMKSHCDTTVAQHVSSDFVPVL